MINSKGKLTLQSTQRLKNSVKWFKNDVLRTLDEEGRSSLSSYSPEIFPKSQCFQVPVWLLVQLTPAVTELIGPGVCKRHARWAVCCHSVGHLSAGSFQNDRTIAKLLVTSLPDLVFLFACFSDIFTEDSMS